MIEKFRHDNKYNMIIVEFEESYKLLKEEFENSQPDIYFEKMNDLMGNVNW
jgi:hypothetical protein